MAKVLVHNGVPTIQCPGCRGWHGFNRVFNPLPNGARWTWNGDVDSPSFTPSMLEKCGPWPEEFMVGRRKAGLSEFDICHSYVTDGKIQFLSDCTHALRGQTVDIPEWTQEQIDKYQGRIPFNAEPESGKEQTP
jgi:hypothetical protein